MFNKEKKKFQGFGSNITFYSATHQKQKIICDNAASQKLLIIRKRLFFLAAYGSSSTGVSWMNAGLFQAHPA